MKTLKNLKARQVLDSRGRPTVEVEATTSSGAVGRAIVPSGASTGAHEALELRDGDPKRYAGLGVLKAVSHVETEIAAALIGKDIEDQTGADALLVKLDGTPNKSRLGANAILGVSLALADAAAVERGEPLFVRLNRLWRDYVSDLPNVDPEPALPLPMVNMISGGLHAGRKLDFQDFLIMAVGAASYQDALAMTVDVYRALGRVLKARGEEGDLVGDEGGYGPALTSNETALGRIVEAAEAAGYRSGADIAIAIDAASTHFYNKATNRYSLWSESEGSLDAEGMTSRLERWAAKYPIVSIEDGLAEDDWDGWRVLTERLGSKLQLVGDDFFVTDAARIARGARSGAGNAALIKLNQIGTLSETLAAMKTARSFGFNTVVSARSGETEDSFIADLATATAAGQIKIGSVARSERLAKYNRLLRIEDALGGPGRARFSRPLFR